MIIAAIISALLILTSFVANARGYNTWYVVIPFAFGLATLTLAIGLLPL